MSDIDKIVAEAQRYIDNHDPTELTPIVCSLLTVVAELEFRNDAIIQQLQRAREALKKYGRHIGTGDCWIGLNSYGGTPECSCGYDDALCDVEAGK